MKIYDEKTDSDVYFYAEQISTCSCRKTYRVQVYGYSMTVELEIEADSELDAYDIAIAGYHRRFDNKRPRP